ncbi:MAG TPA: DUF192 domain-containing protein [Methanobacterium sp.]|nr:DUF192 domain-containing protein [Methanobacterium sp.]
MEDNPNRFLIINRSKGTRVGHADLADSFLSRFMGLMFKGSIEKGLVLKIPNGRGRRGSGIHMFFMRIPLDVMFLDDEKKVVDLVHLKPWQVYNPKKPARFVIELPEGTLSSSNTEIGDELDFTCEYV